MFDHYHEFLAWEEASRDTIDLKKIYIDVADGDLVSGVLLSQIIYWYLPSKNKQSKLKVFKMDESGQKELWLAKGREDWFEECRISPKQFDRSSGILIKLGFLEKKIFKFNGNPTVHIKLNVDKVWKAVNSLLPKGEKPTGISIAEDFSREDECQPLQPHGFYPNGKNDLYVSANSLTEITNTDHLKNNIYTSYMSEADEMGITQLANQQNRNKGKSQNPAGNLKTRDQKPSLPLLDEDLQELQKYLCSLGSDEEYALNNRQVSFLNANHSALAALQSLIKESGWRTYQQKTKRESMLKILVTYIKHFHSFPSGQELQWLDTKRTRESSLYTPKRVCFAIFLAKQDSHKGFGDLFHKYVMDAKNRLKAFNKSSIPSETKQKNSPSDFTITAGLFE